jgi:hypothetical protein
MHRINVSKEDCCKETWHELNAWKTKGTLPALLL